MPRKISTDKLREKIDFFFYPAEAQRADPSAGPELFLRQDFHVVVVRLQGLQDGHDLGFVQMVQVDSGCYDLISCRESKQRNSEDVPKRYVYFKLKCT